MKGNLQVASYAEAVRHLGKSFRSGLPLRTVLDNTAEIYGTTAWDTPEAQKLLLRETIVYTPDGCDSSSRFAFGKARCRRFIRLVMDEIDRVHGVELDENFAECGAALCQRHRVWEAGLFLCAQLFDTEAELRKYFVGRRVLELGAGTGVSAVAYVDSGAEYAVLTDYEEDIVSNMEHSISMNVGECELIETCVLDATDWSEVADLVNRKKIDTIVAADVMYDEDLVVGIMKSLEHVIVEDRIGFLAVTHRNENTMQLLWEQVEESGLRFEALCCSSVDEWFDYLVGSHWDFSKVKVYRVEREHVLRQNTIKGM